MRATRMSLQAYDNIPKQTVVQLFQVSRVVTDC